MHWKKDGRPGIYRLQNLVSGNFYIGSTKNLYRRWKRHQQVIREKLSENIRISEDVNKYGPESFCFGVIEYCEEFKLLEREQLYFEKMNPYYNVWKQVTSAKGRGYTKAQMNMFKKDSSHIKDMELFKEKLREGWKKRKASMTPEELTKKMSEARKGIPHSEETKRKYRETRKGKKKSLEMRKKLSASRTGTKLINGKYIKMDKDTHGI